MVKGWAYLSEEQRWPCGCPASPQTATASLCLDRLLGFLRAVRLLVEVVEQDEEDSGVEQEEGGNELRVAAVAHERLERVEEHQRELRLVITYKALVNYRHLFLFNLCRMQSRNLNKPSVISQPVTQLPQALT